MATRNINRRAVKNYKRPTLRENRSNARSHRRIYESTQSNGWERIGRSVGENGGYDVYDCGGCRIAIEPYRTYDENIEWDNPGEDSYRFDFDYCEFGYGEEGKPVNIFEYMSDNPETIGIFAPYFIGSCGLNPDGEYYTMDIDPREVVWNIDSYNQDELMQIAFGKNSTQDGTNEVVRWAIANLLNKDEVTVPVGFDVNDALVEAIALDIQGEVIATIKGMVEGAVEACGDILETGSDVVYDPTTNYPVFRVKDDDDALESFGDWLVDFVANDCHAYWDEVSTADDFERYTKQGFEETYSENSRDGGFVFDTYEEAKGIVEGMWNYINWDNVRRNLNRTTNESYRRHYTRRSPRTIRESINRRPYHRPIHNRTSYRR